MAKKILDPSTWTKNVKPDISNDKTITLDYLQNIMGANTPEAKQKISSNLDELWEAYYQTMRLDNKDKYGIKLTDDTSKIETILKKNKNSLLDNYINNSNFFIKHNNPPPTTHHPPPTTHTTYSPPKSPTKSPPKSRRRTMGGISNNISTKKRNTKKRNTKKRNTKKRNTKKRNTKKRNTKKRNTKKKIIVGGLLNRALTVPMPPANPLPTDDQLTAWLPTPEGCNVINRDEPSTWYPFATWQNLQLNLALPQLQLWGMQNPAEGFPTPWSALQRKMYCMLELLAKQDFKVLINLEKKTNDLEENVWNYFDTIPELGGGFKYYIIDIPDMQTFTVEQCLQLLNILEKHSNVKNLIHCYAGFGRTGSVMLLITRLFAAVSGNWPLDSELPNTDDQWHQFAMYINSWFPNMGIPTPYQVVNNTVGEEIIKRNDDFHANLLYQRINCIQIAVAKYILTKPEVFAKYLTNLQNPPPLATNPCRYFLPNPPAPIGGAPNANIVDAPAQAPAQVVAAAAAAAAAVVAAPNANVINIRLYTNPGVWNQQETTELYLMAP